MEYVTRLSPNQRKILVNCLPELVIIEVMKRSPYLVKIRVTILSLFVSPNMVIFWGSGRIGEKEGDELITEFCDPRDLPPASLLGNLSGLGKSWAPVMDFSIPPSSWWNMDTS